MSEEKKGDFWAGGGIVHVPVASVGGVVAGQWTEWSPADSTLLEDAIGFIERIRRMDHGEDWEVMEEAEELHSKLRARWPKASEPSPAEKASEAKVEFVTLLPANPNRLGAVFHNDSNEVAYLKMSCKTIHLASGAVFELGHAPDAVYIGQVEVNDRAVPFVRVTERI
jgi:hypothetical protein